MSDCPRRQATLISPSELRSLTQSEDNVVLLDCSWFSADRNAKEEFLKEHIPGAQFFDIMECRDKTSGQPYTLPDKETFESYVGALGVSNDSKVVLYDNNPKFALYTAPRVWWNFLVYGHTNVAILEGGLPHYKLDGFEMTAEVKTVEVQKFNATPRFEYVKKYEDVLGNLDTEKFQLVDARGPGMFNGTLPGPRSGRIPKSVNIPFFDVLDTTRRAMCSVQELKDKFAAVNVDLTKPVVMSCVGGMTSPVVALAAYLCGSDDFAVFNGSWLEWNAKAPEDKKLNMPTDAAQ